jgi:hypothetical protein
MHRIYVSLKRISKVLDEPPSQAVFAIKGVSQMREAVEAFHHALELACARAVKPAPLPSVLPPVPAPLAEAAAVPERLDAPPPVPAAVPEPWADEDEDEEVWPNTDVFLSLLSCCVFPEPWAEYEEVWPYTDVFLSLLSCCVFTGTFREYTASCTCCCSGTLG